MKTEFNFLEIGKIVRELKDILLNNAKIEKVFIEKSKDADNNIYFQVYINNLGKKYLRFYNKFFYLTDTKAESDMPSSTTVFLRKKLTNARISGIERVGCERVIKIVLASKTIDKNSKDGVKKDIIYNIYFELYGNNAFVFCDENDKVIFSNKYKKDDIFSVESLFSIESDAIVGLFEHAMKKEAKDNEPLVKYLATALKLGKVYANEVCLRSSLDENKKVNELSRKEINMIAETIEGMIKETSSSKYAYIIRKDSGILDIVPAKLEYYKKYDAEQIHTELPSRENDLKYTVSYNSAIAMQCDSSIEKETAKEKESTAKKGKIEVIIAAQKKTLEELEKKNKELKETVDAIYSEYADFTEFYNTAKKLFGEKQFDDISKMSFGKNKVREIDKKNKKVVLE